MGLVAAARAMDEHPGRNLGQAVALSWVSDADAQTTEPLAAETAFGTTC
jgi:hypothetical protein